MMNERATPAATPRRWPWRRIVFGSIVLSALFWIGCLFFSYDTELAKAIDVYESLKPGMHISQVQEVMKKAGLEFRVYDKRSTCSIDDHRIYLSVHFDDKEHLCKKAVMEMSHMKTQWPTWIRFIAWEVGLPIDGLYRHWP